MAFVLGLGAPWLHADPYEELTPDQPLYQRVKKLGDYGLLDPLDKQVLDQGKIVTRLELAFYTEKAKARISQPQLNIPTPTPQVSLPPAVEAPALPTATPVPFTAPPVTLPPPVSTDAVKKEIDDLLKQLHAESSFLRGRLALDDSRIQQQEKELENLKTLQDEVEAVKNKANKSSGAPNFNTNTNTRFEQMNISGPVSGGGSMQTNATRLVQEVWVGMWTDLGGKGAFSTGVGAVVPYSNFSASSGTGAAASPASVYVGSPSLTLNLYGDLGKWDTTFAVEAYQPDTTLGDFTRGVAPSALKRFEDPFDIKSFSTDKDAKNWDDYMNSVGFVSTYSLNGGNVQSTSDRVFDGMYAVGHDLPGLGDTRVHFLVGRMGTSPSQTQRWEEALKIDEPLGAALRTSVSTQWVNDQFGVNQVPQVDMKAYSAEVALSLNPVFFDIEGGFSHLFTGFYQDATGVYADPQPMEAGAGQASLSFYPLTLYGFAISENYANFQSKVMMSGIHFNRYGMSFNASDFSDVYGGIGEVDNLVSDRYGWRVNLGWNGRKQDWMKSWPSFLDTFIINLDVAQKKEFVSEQNILGYYTIEPFNELSFYYPDDEGMWGQNLWGGYSSPENPLRQAFSNNIEAIRNDGDSSGGNNADNLRYQFRLSSQRIPLIYPVYNASGQIVTSGGLNQYVNLDNLKAYNYITLTTKLKLDKWFNLPSPVDGSFYMTDNQVSGVSTNPALANVATSTPGQTVNLQNIPDLFQQLVFDGALMVNVAKNVDLMADIGVETWNSKYTYPLIDYRTNVYGLGLAWDIPWGGGKMEFRYKHIDYTDAYVPNNNYSGNQYYSRMWFLF